MYCEVAVSGDPISIPGVSEVACDVLRGGCVCQLRRLPG